MSQKPTRTSITRDINGSFNIQLFKKEEERLTAVAFIISLKVPRAKPFSKQSHCQAKQKAPDYLAGCCPGQATSSELLGPSN